MIDEYRIAHETTPSGGDRLMGIGCHFCSNKKGLETFITNLPTGAKMREPCCKDCGVIIRKFIELCNKDFSTEFDIQTTFEWYRSKPKSEEATE